MVLMIISTLCNRVLIIKSEGRYLPTYTYQCAGCGHEFELRQGFNSVPEHECPQCHKIARRRFHAVGVIYKGSGFYTTDYRKPAKDSSNGNGSSSKTSESKESSKTSESKEASKTPESKEPSTVKESKSTEAG